MADLTLWVDAFWISPYAFSAFVALEEKQLPYAVEEVAMHRAENRAPEYARRSLTARVPMLRHGDFFLSESSAIAEYLEDAFPGTPRVLPADVRQRARARQVMAWVRSDLMPIREERSTNTIFYEPATEPLSRAAERSATKLLAAADALLAPGATSLFGAFSVADADLTLMLQRLGKSGHPLGEKVQRFVDATWSRPSVRKWVERKAGDLHPVLVVTERSQPPGGTGVGSGFPPRRGTMSACLARRLLVLASALAAAPLAAQTAPPGEGLGKPCAEDVARLCPGVKPGGGRIARCLQDRAAEISPSCKARIEQAKEVHEACRADAEKFCGDIAPGGGRVAVCVQQHEAELSPTCRTHLQQVRARFNEVKEACRDDAAKFCSNVPPGRGRVAVCLHEHASELSQTCRAQLGSK